MNSRHHNIDFDSERRMMVGLVRLQQNRTYVAFLHEYDVIHVTSRDKLTRFICVTRYCSTSEWPWKLTTLLSMTNSTSMYFSDTTFVDLRRRPWPSSSGASPSSVLFCAQVRAGGSSTTNTLSTSESSVTRSNYKIRKVRTDVENIRSEKKNKQSTDKRSNIGKKRRKSSERRPLQRVGSGVKQSTLIFVVTSQFVERLRDKTQEVQVESGAPLLRSRSDTTKHAHSHSLRE